MLSSTWSVLEYFLLNVLHHHSSNLVVFGLKVLTLTLPAKKQNKKKNRLGPKLRWSQLLAVKCHYGDTNLRKSDVHCIFAILAKGVFRT